MLLQSNMAISTYEYNQSGDCHSTLHSEYGKSLRCGELSATINAENLNNSNISEQNVCVGDRSGSLLVCDAPDDKVLAGLLVDRTECVQGAVCTFAGIAHALDWLRSRGTSSSPFDHFVLLSDNSTTKSTNMASTFMMTTTSTEAIGTGKRHKQTDATTPLEKPTAIAPADNTAAVITVKSLSPAETGFSFTAAHFPLVLIVSAIVISLLVIALAIGYALSKCCSMRQRSESAVLPCISSQ